MVSDVRGKGIKQRPKGGEKEGREGEKGVAERGRGVIKTIKVVFVVRERRDCS